MERPHIIQHLRSSLLPERTCSANNVAHRFNKHWTASLSWLYRITDRDAYSEAVQIYSNVTDGYGIVGALATEKHIIGF